MSRPTGRPQVRTLPRSVTLHWIGELLVLAFLLYAGHGFSDFAVSETVIRCLLFFNVLFQENTNNTYGFSPLYHFARNFILEES